jgi:hypothetical protein
VIVLGVMLIVVALGATGFAVFASVSSSAKSQTTELTGVGITVSASPLAMFIVGAVTVTLLGLGFALLTRGVRHKVSAHKELHQLRKEKAAASAGTTDAADGGSSPIEQPPKDKSTSRGPQRAFERYPGPHPGAHPGPEPPAPG